MLSQIGSHSIKKNDSKKKNEDVFSAPEIKGRNKSERHKQNKFTKKKDKKGEINIQQMRMRREP